MSKPDTTAFPCMRLLIAVLDVATRMRFSFPWILQATGGTGRPIMFGVEVCGAIISDAAREINSVPITWNGGFE